ncbi:hypothetical protein E2562_026117 [Oryza meyeriana var. granulata]|uniref:Uncharacterized protein n=1 Tax=Oryza meyeriana var. granulata TaxID=110450 RepID=A0A6G1C024_9ORYZ|nr:hypothetical protein E2562_026117 [Oryza meyeriana var. granulata]
MPLDLAESEAEAAWPNVAPTAGSKRLEAWPAAAPGFHGGEAMEAGFQRGKVGGENADASGIPYMALRGGSGHGAVGGGRERGSLHHRRSGVRLHVS